MNEWPKNVDAVGARLVLVPDAVGGRDEDAVGDRVRALHRPPGVDLRRAALRLLGRMPADRRRIEQDLGAEQAVMRAASGYHWSQQISTPIVA